MVEHFQRLAEKISTTNESSAIDELRRENQNLRAMLTKIQQDLSRTRVDLQLNAGKVFQLSKDLHLAQSLIHHDGTFLWCIENIQQEFFNADNSVEPLCLRSSPFFTSKGGYKLSLKLYLNGDKGVRNTHLSLYVTLMRNDFDSLLQWPFRHPITLCLCDQSSRRDHVVHTLKPDPESESFRRPRLELNKSSGIPDFCPL